jgi:predicted HTH transcriptional regulator
MATHTDIEEILARREDTDFEVKAAQGRDGDGELPRSVWESYSAMANTEGGIILLGAREDESRDLTLLGLHQPAKVLKAFWDQINDRHVVSANVLQSDDAQVIEHDGKQLLCIQVPRATRQQRPVYIGPNPLTGTYRRNFEGDYRCDEATVRRMLADSSDESRDAHLLPGFGLADLDLESLAAYRNLFRSARPGHPWITLDERDFLANLGGWLKEREGGKEGPTLAGVLMFGRFRPIHEAVPYYIVDYQERPGAESDIRWLDRVTTDGTWSGNLFDFYRRAYAKLTDGLKVPFRLEHGYQRIDETHVHEAVREALVNTLIHADYAGPIGILAIKQPDRFVFRNPGGLRMSVDAVLAGGTSDCRNRNLQKMFQMVGLGEQAGSGYAKILRAWSEEHWRAPLLRETLQPEYTTLQLPMISLLPQEALDELDRLIGPDFRTLGRDERLALATALIEGRLTNARLREITDKHPRDLTILLRSLVSRGLLLSDGVGRGTYYQLPGAPNGGGLFPLVGAAFATVARGQVEPSTAEVAHSGPDLEHSRREVEHSALEPEHSSVQVEHMERSLDATRALAEFGAIAQSKGRVSRAITEYTILALCRGRYVTPRELATALHRDAIAVRVHYLRTLVRRGMLEMLYPDTPSHPAQAYRTRDNA